MAERSGAAVGFTYFASIMLLLIGVFQAIAGLTAIVKDEANIYVNTQDASYILSLDTTTWGWVHLLLGIVVFLAGLGVLAGQVWARTVGVLVAAGAIIVNFAFIPIYPIWSLAIITLGVLVVWALTVHGRDITTDQF
jgi:hypothetical protein